MARMDSDQVVIVTSRENAEILRISIGHHAQNVAQWAGIEGEQGEPARAALARVRAAQADVVNAIAGTDHSLEPAA